MDARAARRGSRRLRRPPDRRDVPIRVTTLEAALRQICRDLNDAHVSFAVVGGLAVSARTEPRFTRDADIAVAVASDAEAEDLIRRLRALGYSIEALVEQDAVGRLATARLRQSREAASPVTDLLFASSGIEREIVAEADAIELLPQLHIRVATTAHLIALKVLARDDTTRPQDVGDLRALIAVASPAEITRARAALALIATRGYHRGRDLSAELETLLRTRR
jgi:predicted nucleotidyltransferase